MGACGVAALAVLLLASALLPSPATARVLEGDQASSGEGAPAPTTTAGESPKSDASAESGHSSAAGQKPESKRHQEARPSETASKDSKLTSSSDSEKKGQEEGAAQDSTPPPPPVQVTQLKKGQELSGEQVSAPPPPPAQVTPPKEGQEGGDVQASRPPPPPGQVMPPPPPPPAQVTPPPGVPGPESGGAQGGSEEQDTGSQGKETAGKMKKIMEKCDTSRKCSSRGQFSACLQVSENASIGSFVVVLNQGPDDITVNVKATPNIGIDMKPQHLAKGVFGQLDITHITPDGGEITLNDGNGDCVLHIGRSVSDWQQQFQQFTAYATRLNPIYGASYFVFTVVLVGAVCACCKFARRRGNDGVPYQQLEMGAQAPNSSGVDNTTRTADGWEDGWDDDWDDEEAPAKPSDKIPATSVSANGLSLRSQTNGKDGWDVDWDG